MSVNFQTKIGEITNKDARYKADAYEFVMQALWFTQKKLKKTGHISGKELLEGIKELALDQYGPMAKTVIRHWGVNTTEDFGEIVFNMVNSGLMRKNEADTCDEFKDGYNFDKAFNVFNAANQKLKNSNLAKKQPS
jgi:uncharacterized repeat protein (TIGR04138 family)